MNLKFTNRITNLREGTLDSELWRRQQETTLLVFSMNGTYALQFTQRKSYGKPLSPTDEQRNLATECNLQIR